MTDPAPVKCSGCGQTAYRSQTRYGIRDACSRCNMWSWHGKPLVSKEVHEARKHCHEVVDAIWKHAASIYQIEETPGTPEYAKAEKRICKSMRGRVYAYLSHVLDLPEPECHMADQTDIPTLRRIYKAAKETNAREIRKWAKEQKAAA